MTGISADTLYGDVGRHGRGAAARSVAASAARTASTAAAADTECEEAYQHQTEDRTPWDSSTTAER